MRPGADRSAPPRSVVALVATAFVSRDVPDADETELAGVASYVEESVAAMPDVARAGVAFAAAAAYVVLSALGRSPYRRQTPRKRAANAARLAALPLPLVAEFSRLTRGLGLVGVYERRTCAGSLPRGGTAR